MSAIPQSTAEERMLRRFNKKLLRRQKRLDQRQWFLDMAHGVGFGKLGEKGHYVNRHWRRVDARKRPIGAYSRGYFLDAYGEKIGPKDPALFEFAVKYFHPCKGISLYDTRRQ